MKKIELINEVERIENGVQERYKYYKVGAYEVGHTVFKYESGSIRHRMYISKDFKEEFLPDIYFNHSMFGDKEKEFKIQTTSYGSMKPEDIKKVIAGYEEAMEVVEILKELV